MRLQEGIAAAALLAIAVYATGENAPAKDHLPKHISEESALAGPIKATDDSVYTAKVDDAAAWKAQVAEAARSWQEDYCRWALAHDLEMFPVATSDPNEIARGDNRAVVVRYFVSGRELTGRCRFTREGRAIPERSNQIDASAADIPIGQPAAAESSGPPQHARLRAPKGALLDGLIYGSPDGAPLPASDDDHSKGNTAWFPALVVSVHGEPLHAPGEGYVPKYAYRSHGECMAATRQSVNPMALAGIRGRFMCMYHGESEREMSRLPMQSF